MPGLDSAIELDTGVRVVVTPSHSSYFAGEPFSVTVTFTNTHSAEAGPSSRSHTHRRGAHSISSAPLARPPTSPGTPRTPIPSVHISKTDEGEDVLVRRGLVGKVPLPVMGNGSEELPELLEQRRKKLLAKSLSVSITPHELEGHLGVAIIPHSAPYAQTTFIDPRPSPSPCVSSPLTRSDALPLGSKHPHARKQSVMDAQLELISTPIPYTPASSSSTFSLALDPIAEGVLSPYPSTPSLALPTIETPTHQNFSMHPPSNSVYAYPQPRSATSRHRPPQIGLGHPPNSAKNLPRSAFSSTFSQANTELILYSYAQLKGTLSLTPVPGVPINAEQRHTLNAMRSALLKRSVVGGGRMDISASLHSPNGAQHRRRPTHSRSSSFSTGLLNLLSPMSPTPGTFNPSPVPSPSHRSRPSTAGLPASPMSPRFSSSPGVGLGIGMGTVAGPAGPSPGIAEEDVDPEAPLPTFEVQPAMLAVDLSLLPGESRSYTYSIVLPDILPPTFKGRVLRFSYELEVGTCRAGHGTPSTSAGSASANSVSRVMKVPIRIYNNVVVGRTPRPYDVLWPLSKGAKTPSPETQGKVIEETGNFKMSNKRLGNTPLPRVPARAIAGTFDDLQDYARRLLESFPEPGARGVRIKLPVEAISPVPQSAASPYPWMMDEESRRLEREIERAERAEMGDGGLSGCAEAVEILTRNPRKASYDVNKDGVKVAVLTFTKAAYRLGETVLGVVELNQRTSRARVLQLSAILEAHESLPSTISPGTGSRYLRRMHAEHHVSFSSATLRTTFSLDIPSDASPHFQVCVGQNVPGGPVTTLGGLEWKVRLCLLVAVASESAQAGTEGVRMKGMVRDGGRGEWGSAWRAPKSIAPMEKPPLPPTPPPSQTPSTPLSWGAFLASSLFGTGNEGEYLYHNGDLDAVGDEEVVAYDGVKPDMAGGVGIGVNFGGGEDGWKDVKLETVECEVPIKMWPGNTAFKAADIVFDV
ncbi:hypothetical protein H0H87_010626 [Tephrocybe sp. NHM501043]|nr:hypothetical protein H0H87_010626 [Tephrocybe sp. NHM501043]